APSRRAAHRRGARRVCHRVHLDRGRHRDAGRLADARRGACRDYPRAEAGLRGDGPRADVATAPAASGSRAWVPPARTSPVSARHVSESRGRAFRPPAIPLSMLLPVERRSLRFFLYASADNLAHSSATRPAGRNLTVTALRPIRSAISAVRAFLKSPRGGPPNLLAVPKIRRMRR